MINKSIYRLKNHIEFENYKGFDPYDALSSPLFKLPIFNKNKLVRFGAQQAIKRFPINLRPYLHIPKGLNPVSLGLFIQGYAYLLVSNPADKQSLIKRINKLTKQLETLIPGGFSGACWGYDFDWEARHANIPAYQPTVVATGIIANGLFEAYKITKNEELKKIVIDAADFVIKDLNRTYDGSSYCFSYSPFDNQRVFNASMKGARLLSQAYSLTGIEEYKKLAKQAVQFVINHQNEDGSWYYSLAKKGGWVDNYHTGYILDCLDSYTILCKDRDYNKNLMIAYQYYKKTFINEDGWPLFYSNKKYPGDCTAAGQSILTLTRFEDIELAMKVACWTIENMQSNDGSFYFRKFKYYTIKTSFMRWSNAWMFVSLAYLLATIKNVNNN
jgi:hypothetical protein